MPGCLLAAPPDNSPPEVFMSEFVSGLIRCLVCFCLLLCDALLSGWCWVGVSNMRTGSAPGQSFWGLCLVSGRLTALAPPGAVPVVGGYLYPSVLRSPGVTPQECRAAHGPLHPAVTSPLRLCWFCVWFLLGFSGLDVWVFCVVLLVSGVGILFGLVPFRT